MTNAQPDTSPSDSGDAPGAPGRAAGSGLSRPLGGSSTSPFGGGPGKPRVKMLSTAGDLTPAGASFTAPSAAPLPERGAGLHLFLSVIAALVAVTFLILLANRL